MTPAAVAIAGPIAGPIGAPMREALVVLGAAALVIPLLHRVRISPVLGYILIGTLAGPAGLGALATAWPPLALVTITDRARIEPVAELGVVLLMFTIGLEMSWERIKTLRRLLLGLGVPQVLGTAPVLAAGLLLVGQAGGPALVAALALTMSSTATVTQVLADERRLGSLTGRACLAVLLCQDLAVVPVLFLLGELGGGGGGALALLRAVATAAAMVAALAAIGRLGLRPLFRSVARTGSPELFMAACLLVVLATGLAAQAAGLSMALGALIAGLLLAETEYRRQIEVTVEPFKGLLLGVFLISVGLRLDLAALAQAPAAVLGGTAAFMAAKAALAFGLARSCRVRRDAAVQSALLLAPGGEFGFVILGLAGSLGLLPASLGAAVFLAVAVSMASIPAMSALGRRLAAPKALPVTPDLLPTGGEARDVIIAGFGRVGRTVAALLRAHRISFVALDTDVKLVTGRRREGDSVFYGDLSHPEMLQRVGLDAARALVVTIDHRERADAIVRAARQARPDLLIVARARDARHAAALYRMGASDAVPETVEASLQLSEAVLVDLGVAMGPVLVSIHEHRALAQAEIKAMAPPQAQVRRLGRSRLRPLAGND